MKILLTTYHQAFLIRGGGEYEIQLIAENLRQVGIDADIYGPYSRPIENYDAVLHFSLHPGGLDLLREINKKKKPIILWTNFWSIEPISEGDIFVIKEYLDLATIITFKSIAELKHLQNIVEIDSKKIRLCKSIADLSYIKKTSKDIFRELYGVDEFALMIGIVEPNKNQLSAIRAIKIFKSSLVIVGNHRDYSYFEKCKNEGGNQVIFIESLPQKSSLIRSALQGATCFIEVSLEPPGLSSIEAGLSGGNLVLSDMNWSREHFVNYAEYVDPVSINDIEKGISNTISKPKNLDLQNHLINYCFPESLKPLLEIFKDIKSI